MHPDGVVFSLICKNLIMEIVNPTNHFLRKIHTYDLYNNETNQRVLIDVLEPIDTDLAESVITAIPHLMGYKADDSITGFGQSVEEALNDCLKKMSALSWEEISNKAAPGIAD